MSIFDNITAAIHAAATSVGTAWHDHIAPWLSDFMKNTSADALAQVKPIAEKYVAQAIPSLVSAIAAGDTSGYADAQWDAFKATADEALTIVQNVTLNDAQVAVTALISGHPDIVAATAAKSSTTAAAQ